jgi:hypothetical protein
MEKYTKKHIIILCEGKSERAYIQEFNRYMRNNKFACDLHATVVGTGVYGAIERVYKDEHKKNPKQRIEIWIDKDIYLRNRELQERYKNKLEYMPDFRFNYMNFEDFLIMHLEANKLAEWESLCGGQGHFDEPMTAAVYEPLLREHMFRGYKKGNLPEQFGDITQACLTRLFENNKDKNIPFRSDFADFLEGILV